MVGSPLTPYVGSLMFTQRSTPKSTQKSNPANPGNYTQMASAIGTGVPTGGGDVVPVTLCEGTTLIHDMRLRRERQNQPIPSGCAGLIKYCDKFGSSIARPGQCADVRKAVFAPLSGYQNPRTPLLPPDVEAAMLANLALTSAYDAEEVVRDYADRSHADKAGVPPTDLGQVLHQLSLVNSVVSRTVGG